MGPLTVGAPTTTRPACSGPAKTRRPRRAAKARRTLRLQRAKSCQNACKEYKYFSSPTQRLVLLRGRRGPRDQVRHILVQRHGRWLVQLHLQEHRRDRQEHPDRALQGHGQPGLSSTAPRRTATTSGVAKRRARTTSTLPSSTTGGARARTICSTPPSTDRRRVGSTAEGGATTSFVTTISRPARRHCCWPRTT